MSLMQSLKNSPAALRHRFRRDRTEGLSHGDPLFKVHYLGTEKTYSLDVGQAQEAISRLLDGAPGKLAKEHALVVRPRYVEVKEISTGRQLAKTFLEDIAYCAADSAHPNVFLFICRQRSRQLQCRMFWCSRAERAKEITACLADAFQRALSNRQNAPTNQQQGEGPRGREFPLPANPTSRSFTLPAHLGKGGSLEEMEPSVSPSSESDPEEGTPH
ncbi:protein FAM43B-like isoform X1 [Scleropages formosus]|uniref:protein FAM43B-like isoform X1 n=1 Tax=Scleropages formosus TaxID=113540 RepID=UPI000879023B|nr:protein FAM43B-like isoform X1 [Scleropages formosus]XP_018581625.1 protein FAM43B-like isoform X1 [Scleropages formosus]